jgi:flavin reductase (DIM6/NTAB) family NADH-FMN oxidoreductase RutF
LEVLPRPLIGALPTGIVAVPVPESTNATAKGMYSSWVVFLSRNPALASWC